MFFVKSRIDLGTSIGLMSKSKEIPEKPLQSTFPTGYNPTLREFFDSIGRQTTSTWKYDPTNQFIGSQTKEKKKPAQIKDIAIFEFKETKERTKSFKFKLSEGWAAIDQGTWVMHRPPEYPVGMDIYELGEFSQKASEKADPDFSEKNAAPDCDALGQTREPKSDRRPDETRQSGQIGRALLRYDDPLQSGG
ncbi:hypothetical protein N8813_02225 [bacterium]|nr:hypothetical protein [bacterium]